jgi:hypothetical protein
LELARTRHYQTGLVIESGVRCEPHNTGVGGAASSQHLRGRAADLKVPRMTIRQAIGCGFKGIGVRKVDGQWLVSHVDVRAVTLPVVWQYPGRGPVPKSQWT